MNIELMAGKSNHSEMTYGNSTIDRSRSTTLEYGDSQIASRSRRAGRGELPTAGSPHEAIAGRYRTGGYHRTALPVRLRTTVLLYPFTLSEELRCRMLARARFCQSSPEDYQSYSQRTGAGCGENRQSTNTNQRFNLDPRPGFCNSHNHC